MSENNGQSDTERFMAEDPSENQDTQSLEANADTLENAQLSWKMPDKLDEQKEMINLDL